MHNYVLSTSTMVNDLFPMLIIVFARDFDYNKVLVWLQIEVVCFKMSLLTRVSILKVSVISYFNYLS